MPPPPDDEEWIITRKKLEVKSQPGAKGKPVGSLKKDDIVTTFGMEGDWLKIYYPADSETPGWVLTKNKKNIYAEPYFEDLDEMGPPLNDDGNDEDSEFPPPPNDAEDSEFAGPEFDNDDDDYEDEDAPPPPSGPAQAGQIEVAFTVPDSLGLQFSVEEDEFGEEMLVVDSITPGSQAASHKEIQHGMVIKRVGSRVTYGLGTPDIMGLLKQKTRPLTVTFGEVDRAPSFAAAAPAAPSAQEQADAARSRIAPRPEDLDDNASITTIGHDSLLNLVDTLLGEPSPHPKPQQAVGRFSRGLQGGQGALRRGSDGAMGVGSGSDMANPEGVDDFARRLHTVSARSPARGAPMSGAAYTRHSMAGGESTMDRRAQIEQRRRERAQRMSRLTGEFG